MIRWYDYLAAFVFADFMTAGLQFALLGPTVWHGIVGGASVGLLWAIWRDVYCIFRYIMENKDEK